MTSPPAPWRALVPCLRLQDPRHLCVRLPDSSVVLRLRLQLPLTGPQLRWLALASPWDPVPVLVDVGVWSQGAFLACLYEIHRHAPSRPAARRRPAFGKPMAT